MSFLEGFLLAAVIGLMLREASRLADTTRWHVLAGLTHGILAVADVTHWSFFVGLAATEPGAVATVVHVALVLSTGALRNLNHMYAGRDDETWWGFGIFALSIVVMAGGWMLARPALLARVAELTGTVRR